MHRKLPAAIRVASLLALALTPVSAQGAEATVEDDPVVATVNGSSVHRSEVLRVKETLPDQYKSYPMRLLYPMLLDQIINSRLVAAKGRRENLQNDREVRRQMAVIEDRVIQDVFLNRHAAEKVTDDALRARYVEFLRENPAQEQVHARHILLEDEATAKAVIAEIQGGADFADVAKKRSTGPSAAQGGDLGFFGRGDMVPEFSEAAFGLEAGALTETPVQTKFGWHVIKVEERSLSASRSFEDVREELVAELSREAVRDLVQELRDGAEIERFNLDGSVVEPKGPSEEIERAASGKNKAPASKEGAE